MIEKAEELKKVIGNKTVSLERISQKLSDTQEEHLVAQWMNWSHTAKPFAHMKIQDIQSVLGLSTVEDVRSLQFRSVKAYLRCLRNFGFADQENFEEGELLSGAGGASLTDIQDRLVKYLLLKDNDDSGKSKCSIGKEDSRHFIPETYGLNVDVESEIRLC